MGEFDRTLAALAQRLMPDTPYDAALRRGRERMARRHELNLAISWFRRHPLGTSVRFEGRRVLVHSKPYLAPGNGFWRVKVADGANPHHVACACLVELESIDPGETPPLAQPSRAAAPPAPVLNHEPII